MNLSALLLRWRGVDPQRRRAGQGGAGRFTQAAAADKLNTHLKTYQDWEQGRKQPRGAALAYVLQAIKARPFIVTEQSIKFETDHAPTRGDVLHYRDGSIRVVSVERLGRNRFFVTAKPLETKDAGGGVSRETKKNTAQRAATRASKKEKPHGRKKVNRS